MKKGMIIGIIVAVIVIALVVGIVVMGLAPSIPSFDGNYVSEKGTTVVISGNTITCKAKDETIKMEKVGFSGEYIIARLSGGCYVLYNLSENSGSQAEIAIHHEDGKLFFGLYEEIFYLAD